MYSESSSDDERVTKRKRDVVNKDTYKRNIIRKARVKGEEYTNYKGDLVSAKSIPVELVCNCPRKCGLHIDNEIKIEIWNSFYLLQTKDEQDLYLQTLIEATGVKRRKKKNSDDTASCSTQTPQARSKTFVYNVKINGKFRPVCKNVFLQIHGVSRDRVARLNSLLLRNQTPVDMRGKNRSGNAIDGNICVLLHEHISKFEVRETHYGAKKKLYLDAELNIYKMFEMFQMDHPELREKVKYSFYYRYFKENFSLSFGRPQVDVCSECENFKSKLRDPCLSDNVKRSVVAEQIIHKRRANKFYKKQKEMIQNADENTVVLSFDYMQNLPLPKIPVQEVFYMRQLWLNVFCVHNMKTKKAKMYIYHEGEANKSPEEVCSMILHYLKTEVASGTKHLVLFSDGTSGQNKNHSMVRFLMNLCDRGIFETVRHYFPVRGHSFLPCDRDFGCIKRVVRRVDRVYTPNQYAEMILKSSKSGRFTVHQVTHDMIYALNTWWPHFYKKTVKSDETSGRGIRKEDMIHFKVSTYKEFYYNNTDRGKVVTKHFIDGFTSSTFTLKKYSAVPELPTEIACPSGKIAINAKKINDLKNLAKYTTGYEYFFDEILQWPTTEAVCNIDVVYEDE